MISFFRVLGRPCGRRPFWTPLGLQTGVLRGSASCISLRNFGRAAEIRTRDLLHPKQEISITYRQSSMKIRDLRWYDLDAKWTPKAQICRFGLHSDFWTIPAHVVATSPDSAHQVTLTLPGRETRATKGPGRERRMRNMRGNASRKTAAISLPRRFPAVRTNTRALLARSALISSGRYLSL